MIVLIDEQGRPGKLVSPRIDFATRYYYAPSGLDFVYVQ